MAALHGSFNIDQPSVCFIRVLYNFGNSVILLIYVYHMVVDGEGNQRLHIITRKFNTFTTLCHTHYAIFKLPVGAFSVKFTPFNL